MTISVTGQILAMAIAFPARIIFINYLNTEYLGLNSLFSNIITLLSLADLGIGTAIVFSLYKPISDNNIREIQELLNFYKKMYTFIGLTVFILGICILPFLKFIAKDNGVGDVKFLFLLFVLNASISYFFSYKRSIIIAYQKNYVVNLIHYCIVILMNIVQMLVLFLFENYTLFLLVSIFFTVVENIVISIISNKMYPVLFKRNDFKISETKLKELIQNIKAIVLHKIGSAVILGTDNIIISMNLGVYWVGLYSNYYLLINSITSIINQMFNSITASVGNLLLDKNQSKKEEIFNKINFFNYWIISVFSICIFVSIESFVKIWVGHKFLLPYNTVLILIFLFYVMNMRNAVLVYKSAAGLFKQDKYKPIVEGILNIIFSLVLVRIFGISGVIFGTLLSVICTSLWIEPFIVYKYIFKKSLYIYCNTYIKYFLVFLINLFFTTKITMMIANHFYYSEFFNFIILSLSSFAISNLTLILIFRNKKEYQFLKEIAKRLILKLRRKL